MSKPAELRHQFLGQANEVIELIFKILRDPNKEYSAHQRKTIELVWPTLSKILVTADDPITIAWDSPETRESVDRVMRAVVAGEMSIDQGKKFLAMFSIGFDMAEFPALMEQLNQLEKR